MEQSPNGALMNPQEPSNFTRAPVKLHAHINDWLGGLGFNGWHVRLQVESPVKIRMANDIYFPPQLRSPQKFSPVLSPSPSIPLEKRKASIVCWLERIIKF